MKVFTYIKSCNREQFAQLISSAWWTDKELDIMLAPSEDNNNEGTIEKLAKGISKTLLNEQIPKVIRFNNTSWIDTKTKELKL